MIRPNLQRLARRLHLECLEHRHLLSGDVAPLGALIRSIDLGSGTLATGQSATTTLGLDGNLTIAFKAVGAAGLAPRIVVADPMGNPVASDSASINGTALVQSVYVTDPGDYQFTVETDSGSAGDYTSSLVLNAAIDEETAGGTANNTPTAAQDIQPAFFDLNGTITRGGVVGTTSMTDTDYFRFSLADGQQVALAAGSTDENLRLELWNDDGSSLLARGIAVENVTQSIQGFVDATSDGLEEEYLVRLSTIQPIASSYGLEIVVGADFEREENNSFDSSYRTSGAQGHVSPNDFSDLMLLSDFPGTDANQTTCDCQPPDPHVAVGTDHVVQVVNTAIAIYDKAGNVLQGPMELDQFFRPSIVNGETFTFDPVVAYDELTERFIVGVLSAPSAPSESDFLYAVSDSSDPTLGFSEQHRFDFNGISPGLFADYPKIGWNADAHVFSFNMFQLTGGGVFQHTTILTVDKTTVLDANSNTIASTIVKTPGLNTDFTLAAATMHDAVPGDPMWFVKATFDGDDTIGVIRMDDVLTASPIFTTFDVPVTPYLEPANAAQPGKRTFRTNDARMLNSEWRDGRLVATHAVGATDGAKARWYDIDVSQASPILLQEGTIDPGPGVSTYFPSIAINRRGDIGLTYMQSSATEFVSMYVTGQIFGATAGTVSEPILVAAGDQIYFGNRGGDYSGTVVDPITDAFWSTNEFIVQGQPDPLWSTWVAEYTVRPLADQDWNRFAVTAGDSLVLTTTTPYDAADLPANLLDPTIELFAPDGSLVAVDDNSAPDGRNALLSHTAVQSGDYRAVIRGAQNTSGDYTLQIAGDSGIAAPPAVVSMTPFDGITVNQFPTSIRLDFSDAVLAPTVSASDLIVAGIPAIDAQLIDGDTVEFSIDPLSNNGDQTYDVVIAGGAMTNLAGTSFDAFTGSFVLDTSGPTINATLWNGIPFPSTATFATGPLTVDFSFNEQLFTLRSARLGLKSPSPEDVILSEMLTGTTVAANSVDFDPNLNVYTAHFDHLAEGNYELRLISGDGAFEDEQGNDLDGEPSASIDGTPTGDGLPGGDYLISFFVDNGTTAAPAQEFVRLAPLGGLITSSLGNQGAISQGTDEDLLSFFVEAGETVSARITPTDGSASLELELSGVAVGAANPGAAVILPPQLIPANGLVSIQVRANVPTAFQLDIYRNANLDGLNEAFRNR